MKFDLLRTVSMKVPKIVPFEIYRGKTDYEALKKAQTDFEIGINAFQPTNTAYGHEQITLEAFTLKMKKKGPKLPVAAGCTCCECREKDRKSHR